jgi:Flp pilus assembly pilin Flp
MTKLISQFVADEAGAGAVEYALVIVMAIAIVTAVSSTLKTQVSAFITQIGAKLTNAVNTIS